ncbi:MAG: ABC transporter substrate-binding protein, partial [Gammaproteobacteria bacterium]|nr:ABC transporter substrate-binding protein [Gammaproteobacteria bacterium]
MSKRIYCWFFMLALAACSKQAPEPITYNSNEANEVNETNVEPIKIGDIMSYSQHVEFTRPSKQGWMLALDEINAKGGVLGRPVEVVSRDAKGDPGVAVTAVQDLHTRENIQLIMGAFLSNVGLAISEATKREGMLYMATW